LCFALRPAGRAFGSGFAALNGCPGGASGRRIELMIDAFRFPRFEREDFIAYCWGDLQRDAIPAR
jgi:hypothetical protein